MKAAPHKHHLSRLPREARLPRRGPGPLPAYTEPQQQTSTGFASWSALNIAHATRPTSAPSQPPAPRSSPARQAGGRRVARCKPAVLLHRDATGALGWDPSWSVPHAALGSCGASWPPAHDARPPLQHTGCHVVLSGLLLLSIKACPGSLSHSSCLAPCCQLQRQ